MGLKPGVRMGPYEVLSPLGAGGMGEVYRARDTRIGRDVAVKVLPSELSQDGDRLRRFEQEARAAGALNHPNILALYDVGRHDSTPYAVTELLEGETLRERLGGSALHVRKAVEIAVSIARGLAAAHEKGIVHRDLKPDNVFLTRDGQVKILDFGLAKLTHPELASGSESRLATVTRGTDPGTVLGTVGYMSPEQVRGRAVDHRSDIFSLGTILYEMLSGRRAFAGDSAVETLNAILKEEPPDLTATNRLLPPALERIVRHCLEKSPDERFASARDLAFDLQSLSETTIERPAAPRPRRRRALIVTSALGLAWLLTGAGAYLVGRRMATPPQPNFRLLTFRRGAVFNARFAPDGQTFFYNAQWGERGAYTASFDSPEPRPVTPYGFIAGVAPGEVALLVPAGNKVTLVRVPVGGGAPREVAADVLTADWAPGGDFAVVREQGGRQRVEFPLGRVVYESPNDIRVVRVSPSGRQLALSENLRGYVRSTLRIIDAAGTSILSSGGWTDIDAVAWSPDERAVWLSGAKEGRRGKALWSVSVEGVERVAYRGADPLTIWDMGRDGRMMASVGRYRFEMAGRAPGDAAERDLTWLGRSFVTDLSADGRDVLFEDGPFAKGRPFMFLRRTDGSAPVQLAQGTPGSLSPDGRWALGFPVGDASAFQPTLAVVPTGAGQSHVLPRGTIDRYLDAFWFPDGRKVLVLGQEKDRPLRLFEQSVDKGDPRPVTPEGVATFQPTITPDGFAVLAATLEPGALFRLYPLDGSEPTGVPGLREGDTPLRYDGTGRFVFVREPLAEEGRAVIVRVDTRSGQRERWLDLRPADRVGVGPIEMVRLSADGRSYAYSAIRELSNLFLVDGLR